MTPLTTNPLRESVRNERSIKMEQELKEFLNAECEFAELWTDESVGAQRNIECYKREARRLGQGPKDIKIFQKNYKVYAHNLNLGR